MIFPPLQKTPKEPLLARPSAGAGTRLAVNAAFYNWSATGGRKWRHPWFTRASWDGKRKQWTATVKPGFVNGNAPFAQTLVSNVPVPQQDFGINPLTGKPFFSDPIFNHGGSMGPGTSVIAMPMFYNPPIDLTFRNIGFDSINEAPPDFFAKRGVQNPPHQPTDDELLAGASLNLDAQPAKGNRLLRACDLVLHQPREALSSDITFGAGPATGISSVQQTLTVILANPNDYLKVFATGKFVPAAGIDPTQGDFTEANFDEIVVSTVYLLSPLDTALYSAPDETWTPYVKHNLFWDLNWMQPAFRILDSDNAIGGLLSAALLLGGGTASIAINFLSASINDAFQNALNVLTAHSLAGTFWTPTGGGSDSAFPQSTPPAQPASGHGLDKDGRLLAQRQQAARLLRAEQLDPAFPYRCQPFDPSLLS